VPGHRYLRPRPSSVPDGPTSTIGACQLSTKLLLRVKWRVFHKVLRGPGRHYGLLASSARKASIARARELLSVAPPPETVEVPEPLDPLPPCPC